LVNANRRHDGWTKATAYAFSSRALGQTSTSNVLNGQVVAWVHCQPEVQDRHFILMRQHAESNQRGLCGTTGDAGRYIGELDNYLLGNIGSAFSVANLSIIHHALVGSLKIFELENSGIVEW
jgi:hypothetical protein